MAKFKKMTQKEFNQIKEYQKLGIDRKVVEQITKRSYHTVRRVFLANTMEDYKNSIQVKKENPKTEALGLLYENDLKLIVSKLDEILKNQKKMMESPIF